MGVKQDAVLHTHRAHALAMRPVSNRRSSTSHWLFTVEDPTAQDPCSRLPSAAFRVPLSGWADRSVVGNKRPALLSQLLIDARRPCTIRHIQRAYTSLAKSQRNTCHIGSVRDHHQYWRLDASGNRLSSVVRSLREISTEKKLICYYRSQSIIPLPPPIEGQPATTSTLSGSPVFADGASYKIILDE